jgi:hypothetical protein
MTPDMVSRAAAESNVSKILVEQALVVVHDSPTIQRYAASLQTPKPERCAWCLSKTCPGCGPNRGGTRE